MTTAVAPAPPAGSAEADEDRLFPDESKLITEDGKPVDGIFAE